MSSLLPDGERALRDRLGFSASETRTRAERAAVAGRIKAKAGLVGSAGLPLDIESVWGGGRLDSSGMLAADTARFLIGEWGLERFRSSAIHKAAIQDRMHTRARADARSDFRKRDLEKR